MGIISRIGDALRLKSYPAGLGMPRAANGWLPVIRESFAGAWQTGVTLRNDEIIQHYAVFSCITLIASDISKLPPRYMREDANGIWQAVDNSAYSPVLEAPNSYQTRLQFWESWMLSKLSYGNAYVLLERNGNGNVDTMHVLDPARVQPLVSSDGEVFYQLSADHLAGVENSIIVPARDVIHDRWNTLYHPLIGLSPLSAAALAAQQGVNIQTDSIKLFENAGIPSGILTAPGSISKETAERLSTAWTSNYGGTNKGKVAVLGDGLTFNPMTAIARDSQLVEQLKWSGEVVCSVFHVPPYKIGVAPPPAYNNIQALNQEYYSQALQVLLESAERLLDMHLGLGRREGVEFDLDALLRMDTQSFIGSLKEAVQAGLMAPNEARRKLNLPPQDGGGTVYLQQQMYSLAALAKRDAGDPFAPPPAPALPPPDEPDDDGGEDETLPPAEDQEARSGLAALREQQAELRGVVSQALEQLKALQGSLETLTRSVATTDAAAARVADLAEVFATIDGRLKSLETAEPEPLAVQELSAAINGGKLVLELNGRKAEAPIDGLPQYRGVWKAGELYPRGSMVSLGGSVWHADRETDQRPRDGDDWTLAVKHGRDGRDGRAPPASGPVALGRA